MDAFNRILVPVNFSAHSDLALCYATTIADWFGAGMPRAKQVSSNSFIASMAISRTLR